MLDGVVNPFPDADLSVLVVWIALKDTDTPEAADEASGKFSDGRVTQFFDPGQLAGKAVAESLGHMDKVAWDFYLFYPPGVQWEELPPEPECFMHQLPGGWPDSINLFEKKKLTKKLEKTMKSFFP